MGNYDTYKTLLIFFSPLLFRKARSLYYSIHSSLAQRPHPRPLPSSAALALNILFVTTSLFLFLSLPSWTGLNPHAPSPNIFALTQSRLTTPTELLFARLARLRPNNTLTNLDTQLKAKFTSQASRKLYLRYGPETLLNCPFCTPGDETTYLLYYLPLHTFLPHLLHLLITGLVTSNPLTGRSASRFRSKFTLTALSLLLIETLLVAFYNPASTSNPTANKASPPLNPHEIPTSFHNRLTTLRLLSFTIFDALAAATIYLASTHRFFYLPPTPAEVAEQLVANASATLASATAKVHAVSVVRNAIVRDRGLKARDDAYWTAVVAMEGSGDSSLGTPGVGVGEGGSVWEEEEVVRAMTKVMQKRNAGAKGDVVDIGRLGVEAASYVEGVTAGLERGDDDGDGGGDGRDGNAS
ncbi:hypothetical protein ACJ73_00604 [Blastomyces percursus]|uniref:Uncharacterized protein n=1 Tax=Blastomyces percursus TaxID=1658174 RepID=A0A1J9QGN8_9EURO|nr:hypothetical protein ACJ73_00604 [Blastomyces percursus]